MEKEKVVVGRPYADRKSNQFEVIAADPPCPRCYGRLSNLETSEGLTRWCITCGTIYPYPTAPVV